MLVKYYLSDNIKAPFEDFTLGLRNDWAGPRWGKTKSCGARAMTPSFEPTPPYCHPWIVPLHRFKKISDLC